MPTNLSEKIRFINRQNELLHGRRDEEDAKEAQSETQLVDTVEQVWADAQEKESLTAERPEEPVAVEPKMASEPIDLATVYRAVETLTEKIDQAIGEIAKINKHVNATQKMLKKTKEKK